MPRLSNESTLGTVLSTLWRAELDDHVPAFSLSPDGGRLAAASLAGPIAVLDTAGGETVLELAGHQPSTLALEWSPAGGTIASGGMDGAFRLWNARTGVETAVLEAGSSWGEHVAWRGDGELLATAAGRFLRLWAADGTLVRSFEPHPSTVGALCWAPKGREISTVCYGGLYMWARHQPAPVRRSELQSSLLALAWSPDARFAAAGEQSGAVHLWRSNGKGELEMYGFPSKVRHLSWSADSRWLATSGGDGAVLWDCAGRGPDGRSGRMLEGHDAAVSALSFHPTEDLLACGDEQGRLSLYAPNARRRPLGAVELDEPVALLAWSRDGRILYAAGGQGTIVAYERP